MLKIVTKILKKLQQSYQNFEKISKIVTKIRKSCKKKLPKFWKSCKKKLPKFWKSCNKVTKILKKLHKKSYQNFEKVATKVIYFLIYSFKIAIVKKTFFPGSNDHTIAVQFYSVMYNMTLWEWPLTKTFMASKPSNKSIFFMIIIKIYSKILCLSLMLLMKSHYNINLLLINSINQILVI